MSLFYLSKILAIFTQPLIWAAVLFALSMGLWWARHRASARWLMLAALGWTALVGWLPLPEALLRELENRHPATVEVAAGKLQAYTGVVVLGGSPERLKASITLLRCCGGPGGFLMVLAPWPCERALACSTAVSL